MIWIIGWILRLAQLVPVVARAKKLKAVLTGFRLTGASWTTYLVAALLIALVLLCGWNRWQASKLREYQRDHEEISIRLNKMIASKQLTDRFAKDTRDLSDALKDLESDVEASTERNAALPDDIRAALERLRERQ